ncbi:MAG: M23 family metallopeptidase [Terrimicrobiaceae bacterium]|nr:M23 family metallopeptidase [Terrimicrobiaceae bacterium]
MRKSWFWLALSVGVATLVGAPDPNVARTRVADGFDFPVGKPNADGYYKARGFRPNGHLGEDWNGIGGGNTDLGSPIYSTANGLVVFARDVRLGWGNVIVIRHIYFEGGDLKTVDSLYGHLDRIVVKEGQQVLRGQQVGTMGTNRGMYPAHLHFEIHKNISMGVTRTGFRHDFTNYYAPSDFINPRRRLAGGGRSALIAINTFNDPRFFGPPSGGSANLGAGRPTRPERDPVQEAAKKQRSNTFRVDRFGGLDSF